MPAVKSAPVLLPLLLGACTIVPTMNIPANALRDATRGPVVVGGSEMLTLPVAGAFKTDGEAFHGTVTAIGNEGYGRLEVTNTSGVRCMGATWYETMLSGGAGSLGAARLVCSDGRRVTVQFANETARTGLGSGTGQWGRELAFRFGADAEARFAADQRTGH